MNHVHLSIVLFVITSCLAFGQNTVSVPFPNGFIGTNTGNNSAGTSYYLSGAQSVGWSDIRFSQTTNSNVFITQGNDIVGTVEITDNSGINHEIPGFIKWRTPSGNNPHTMVFQPAPGTYSLATNGFNGSSTYTIDENKYIGLTKPGATLTINPVPGDVSGNASTSGLLDALNAILGDIPQLNVTGTTVLEQDGTAGVTIDLNTTSTQTITTYLRTRSGTAMDTLDYDSTFTLVSFSPGETQKTVNIPIIVDGISEFDEYFLVQLFESTNAAITNSQDTVWVTETVLPVDFVSASVQCSTSANLIQWTTASEKDSYQFEVYKSIDGLDWQIIGSLPAQGNSNQETNYEFLDNRDFPYGVEYYKIVQLDWNGQSHSFPIIQSNCETFDITLYPNPAKQFVYLSFGLHREEAIQINLIDIAGKSVLHHQIMGNEGSNVYTLDLNSVQDGSYLISIQSSFQTITKPLRIHQ